MTVLSPSYQVKSLNRYLTIDPQKEANKLKVQALAWQTLAMISTVAFIGIMGVGLAFSFGLITIPVGIFVPLFLTSVPLNWGLGKCFTKQRQANDLAQIEKGVAKELRKIANWTPQEIKNFLQDHEIASEKNQDLSSELLSGIARYYYFENIARDMIHEAKKDLSIVMEDREIEDLCRLHAMQMFEYKAFPSLITAARMLEILRQPDLEMNLQEDHLVIKTFEQRMLHLHYSSEPNDDYVKWPEGTISFEQIKNKPDPTHLRALRFPALKSG